MHDSALVLIIAISLACAFVGGFIAHKLRMSPIVGYLLAGIVIGPYTPGFVANTQVAQQLSEIGVILLMFGVGMNFSIRELLSVRAIAVPGAILQAAVSATLVFFLALSWGWSTAAAVFFSLAMAVSSTVVLVKAHERRQSLGTLEGRAAVGWTIVEDLISVLALVMLPALAPALASTGTLPLDPGLNLIAPVAWTLAKVAVFVFLMIFIGRRVCPWLLGNVAKGGSRELFTLFVIGFALGIASLSSQLFSVSVALGAFFAGIVMSESELSHRAAAKVLPFQEAFAVLFFVSVGMLFEPSVLLTDPLRVILILSIILGVKSTVSFMCVLLLRYPLRTALTVGASVAQIGEFSFILAALGRQLDVLPSQAYSLILAGSLISISLNPLVFRLIEPLESLLSKWKLLHNLRRRDDLAMSPIPATTKDHVVLVGYGRSGKRVGRLLKAENIPFVVIEQNREIVRELRQNNIAAVYGDAEIPEVLKEASIQQCKLLIVTAPDPYEIRQICDHADDLNPSIRVIARTHSEEEQKYLESLPHMELVVLAERELAAAINNHVNKYYRTLLEKPKST